MLLQPWDSWARQECKLLTEKAVIIIVIIIIFLAIYLSLQIAFKSQW